MTPLKVTPAKLQTWCTNQVFPEQSGLKIRRLTEITAGWESRLFAFELRTGSFWRPQRQNLVLRLYQGQGAHSKAAHEFHSMRQLFQTGYPVPKVLYHERDETLFGAPWILMEKIEGQIMWKMLEKASPEQLTDLINQFCRLFVDLHQLDWRIFAHQDLLQSAENPFHFVDEWLMTAHNLLKRGDHIRKPPASFQPVIAWLAAQRDQIPCNRPAPLHWDFHPNNILVCDDHRAFVIDWPGFQISDPRFDLAWTLLLADSYAGTDLRQAILDDYQRLSGTAVEKIEIFEVFACVRRLYDIYISLSQGAEQIGMLPQAAESMRQQREPIQRVQTRLHMHTGLNIPEISRLLEI